jgi:predicted nuclease of restriction endonuclease-like RecB superfamily
MSFRLADLKKSVRKSGDGHRITPALLDGRQSTFQIEFVLQQFEGHLGKQRRLLDPDLLLDFVGDARLGRGLLATLAQWYRMRARTFPEVLGAEPAARLAERGIAVPMDLRAWLYAAVNRGGKGYLDPEAAPVFWQSEARALGLKAKELSPLTLLDRAEEAVLVRTGPRPTAEDVMAAYNARAHTTLLRSATEITLRCGAGSALIRRAALAWAAPLDVEWSVDGDTLRLAGRADALGCWTRHGRRVERAALELLALPDLEVREARGRLLVSEKRAQFHWKADTLAVLGAGSGAALDEALPERIDGLAAALRKERERAGSEWGVRRPAHVVGVVGGVCLPHLELRRGDRSLYLRLADVEGGETLRPFRGKTPLAHVAWTGEADAPLIVRFAGELAQTCALAEALPLLAERLDARRAAPLLKAA